MASSNPFRGLIIVCSGFVTLVVAFDTVVLVVYSGATAMLPAAVVGTVLALGAVVAIVGMVITGHHYRRRAQQLLAGDDLVRWHYAEGEWQHFVAQERARATRVALLFLPLVLGLAALFAVLSQVWSDPLLGSSVPLLLLIAAGLLVVLVAGPFTFARRARLPGDTCIGLLGILRPDGYIPLHGAIYHLAAAEVMHGSPSLLRLQVRLGRVGSLLAFLGSAPTQWEVRVPVPAGHELEAAQIAAQLLQQGPSKAGRQGSA